VIYYFAISLFIFDSSIELEFRVVFMIQELQTIFHLEEKVSYNNTQIRAEGLTCYLFSAMMPCRKESSHGKKELGSF